MNILHMYPYHKSKKTFPHFTFPPADQAQMWVKISVKNYSYRQKKVSTVPAIWIKAEELHSGQDFVEGLAVLLVGNYPTHRWHLEGSSTKKKFIPLNFGTSVTGKGQKKKPTKNKQVNILTGIHSYRMFQLWAPPSIKQFLKYFKVSFF